jgi:hypothetical protein
MKIDNIKIGHSIYGFFCYYDIENNPFKSQYIHRDGTTSVICGIENFYDTAREAGEAIDKFIKLNVNEPVKVTREEIVKAMNLPEDFEIV